MGAAVVGLWRVGVTRAVAERSAMHAGLWRGLPVAIKTILFQSEPQQQQTASIASEAAIASNLSHSNVVATYSHDIRSVENSGASNELAVFKFYLVQVSPAAPRCALAAMCCATLRCCAVLRHAALFRGDLGYKQGRAAEAVPADHTRHCADIPRALASLQCAPNMHGAHACRNSAMAVRCGR